MMLDSVAIRVSHGPFCKAGGMSVVVALAMLTGGCNRPTTQPAPPAVAVSPEQQSFDRIVRYMEHMLVEPDPSRPNNVQQFPAASGGSESDSTGVLTYEMQVDASDKVIPPANPGDPPRAKIVVTMATSYARIVRPRDRSKEESEDESTQGNDSSKVELGNDPLEDQQLSGDRNKNRESAPKAPKRTVTLDPVEEKVEFDLEYVDGKWRLVSEDIDTRLSAAVESLQGALAHQ